LEIQKTAFRVELSFSSALRWISRSASVPARRGASRLSPHNVGDYQLDREAASSVRVAMLQPAGVAEKMKPGLIAL
jgi:hypothetical protein